MIRHFETRYEVLNEIRLFNWNTMIRLWCRSSNLITQSNNDFSIFPLYAILNNRFQYRYKKTFLILSIILSHFIFNWVIFAKLKIFCAYQKKKDQWKKIIVSESFFFSSMCGCEQELKLQYQRVAIKIMVDRRLNCFAYKSVNNGNTDCKR